MALTSSRAILVITCSGLRPRWCPEHSPWRILDCCLPMLADRRLSRFTSEAVILLTTTIHVSGLNHTACVLARFSFGLRLPG